MYFNQPAEKDFNFMDVSIIICIWSASLWILLTNLNFHFYFLFSPINQVLKIPTPSDDEIFKRLLTAVEFSINTMGYKWTFFKNQGGWAAVLKKYPKVFLSSSIYVKRS